MALEVIGAGLGRTGTLSLKHALETLGFDRCYHMMELIQNPTHLPHWNAALNGDAVDWDTLFTGYRATVDWPGATHYKTLAEHYPDAKVVLTVRDPERWYDSVNATINPNQLSNVDPPAHVQAIFKLNEAQIWEGQFAGQIENRDYMIAAFERFNQEVRDTVPSDRLLVYEVRDGWDPLCSFLNRPVPKEPFPRVNTPDDFHSRLKKLASSW